MIDLFADFINIPQLEILGFTKEYVYFLLFFIILFGIWLVVRPIMAFIIRKNYIFSLTFILSSLVLIAITSVLTLIDMYPIYIEFIFQIIILFGFSLSIYLVYQFLKTKA